MDPRPLITIYGKPYCGFCEAAKSLCMQLGKAYEYVDIMDSPERMAEYQQLADTYRHYTVPLILADDEFIGGFRELQTAAKAGKFS